MSHSVGAIRTNDDESNSSTVFIFVTCDEKYHNRVASIEQLGLTATRTTNTAFVGVKANRFFPVFFYHLLVLKSVLFPLDVEGLGETKLTVFL